MDKILLSDVMTRNPISVKPETSLLNCAKKMVKKRVGSLIISGKNNEFKGILTEKDILWALVKKSKKDLSEINAINISPKKVYKLKPDMKLKEAVDKIKKSKYKVFPIVQKEKFVGLVTIRDILSFNPDLYPELNEFSKIREESKKLKRISRAKKGDTIEGECDVCGKKDSLHKSGKKLLCERCGNSI